MLKMSANGSDTELFLCQYSFDCEELDVFPAVKAYVLSAFSSLQVVSESTVPNMGCAVRPYWFAK